MIQRKHLELFLSEARHRRFMASVNANHDLHATGNEWHLALFQEWDATVMELERMIAEAEMQEATQ